MTSLAIIMAAQVLIVLALVVVCISIGYRARSRRYSDALHGAIAGAQQVTIDFNDFVALVNGDAVVGQAGVVVRLAPEVRAHPTSMAAAVRSVVDQDARKPGD